MKLKLLFASASLFLMAALSASASTCPSTATTSTDCDYLITIGTAGAATVSQVMGSTPFNSMITFPDGTSDPGNDSSLVGVIDNYSKALTSLTLMGSGANAGIFDFSFNGICAYTNAAYCSTAASGYEGPTTTFSNLMSTVPFQTNVGTVNFGPALAPGASSYFSLEDSAADINANGGLTVTGETFAGAPEPSQMALIALGISLLAIGRNRWFARKSS